ncbi:hypothetical protein AA103196_2731 [Ameyamaea chiangmaiensis NBRC 103196]|uniref:Uncharacterized protein n=1 Tax=Ameyamaea chiangmaiensis TaxID=442969 RepID=A0A850P3C3_9PROT|nr:hypothetical protein [Ameyamaea chiangmaiensis]MBS4074222.1 hypothetical protein [Ameyamaea chiangmaiensis]NVN39165.1 hypothetical protein [Ameyamaea chiangmaiensis]GBQ71295.1 hypothetical protein AA103196_2731 [Ameyamaea chiangmaiensis NBRC 103196]
MIFRKTLLTLAAVALMPTAFAWAQADSQPSGQVPTAESAARAQGKSPASALDHGKRVTPSTRNKAWRQLKSEQRSPTPAAPMTANQHEVSRSDAEQEAGHTLPGTPSGN